MLHRKRLSLAGLLPYELHVAFRAGETAGVSDEQGDAVRNCLRAASVAIAFSILSGCTDTPAPVTAPLDGAEARSSVAPPGTQVQRMRLDLSAATDLRTTIPVALVTPAAASNIGPGSAIIITIPDEGRFGCTANFVWRSGGRRYLGAAGHCFIPADRAATHGPGADYDASGVTVEVCVSGCEGNFNTNQITGTWVTLGSVRYARQTLDGEDVGNDFGVVEVPREYRDFIRTTMPVWGGPTGVETLALGDFACHYGNGLLVGDVFVTKARMGVGGGSDDASWLGDFAAAFGDSGSGLVGCAVDGLGSVSGTGAIGVLTHIGVGLDETTGEHGVTFGTTIARAIAMGAEAGLNLRLVLQ